MIIAQPSWFDYTRASTRTRPTVSVYVPEPITELSAAAKDPRLMPTHLLLDEIAALPENWDTYGSAKPNPLAIHRARQFVEDVFAASALSYGWQSPYVSASEDGAVVFEWWHGARKLTVYIGAEASTYLKSWGADVQDEMEDGELAQNWLSLWSWLFNLNG